MEEQEKMTEESGTKLKTAAFAPHTAIFGDEEARQYLCRNCGAILVTDNHTAMTDCLFCGSQMTLGKRISGDYAPTKIIPFNIPQKNAAKAFQKWRRKIAFAPKEFARGKHIREVTGIYIPVWIYDLKGQGAATLHCTKNKTYDTEEETVTETSHFEVLRKTDLTFRQIPGNASKKLSDRLVNQLKPFDFYDRKDFPISYLASHAAEKYDVTGETLLPRIQKQAQQYMDECIADTVKDYDTAVFEKKEYNISPLTSDYTLLPVWIAYYDYGDEEYIFAMNGQTGKIAANPPISKIKVATSALLIIFFTFLFFRIITVLLGGPLL